MAVSGLSLSSSVVALLVVVVVDRVSDLRVQVSTTRNVCVRLPAPVHLMHVFVSVSRVWEVDGGDLWSELLRLDGDSCESRSAVLHFLDVFGPSLVHEDCRSVACFAVSCCGEGVSLSRHPQFFFVAFSSSR